MTLIGVSWNKIFAKLGSDYKKPDAITVISKQNYKNIVYPLPAGDLLFVGNATQRKLYKYGILTIGDLAEADPVMLLSIFGKVGLILHVFANGNDETPVSVENTEAQIKSIGNSMTTPRDLVNDQDVKIVLYLISESVAARLRENQFACKVVEVSVRDNGLYSFTRQHKIETPTNITGEIAEEAMRIFLANYKWQNPIRSVGVRACDLCDPFTPVQLSLFSDENYRDRLRKVDRATDDIRKRFGYYCVQRGLMYCDPDLSHVDAKKDHTIHPHGYMERGNRTGVKGDEVNAD